MSPFKSGQEYESIPSHDVCGKPSPSAPAAVAIDETTLVTIDPQVLRTTCEWIEEEEESPEYVHSRKVAAGVTSGLIGCCFFGGCVPAILLGLGCAYATTKEGCCGDTSRAIGEVGLTCRRKAKELDEKHDIASKSTKRTKVVVLSTVERAKELDQNHGILSRTKDSVVYVWEVVTDFAGRHRLVERSVEGVGSAAYWAADRVSAQMNQSGNTNDNNPPLANASFEFVPDNNETLHGAAQSKTNGIMP